MAATPKAPGHQRDPQKGRTYNRQYWEAVEKDLAAQEKKRPKPNRGFGTWKPLGKLDDPPNQTSQGSVKEPKK